MTVDRQRRQFLHGGRPLPLRPPWAVAEGDFVKQCSRCSICITVCPHHILEPDIRNFPQVNFSGGECSFCGLCVDQCPTQALKRQGEEAPWQNRASIATSCLALRGTVCRSCGEHCPAGAIRFRPLTGGRQQPQVDGQRCTGCGACFGACPVRAITIGS